MKKSERLWQKRDSRGSIGKEFRCPLSRLTAGADDTVKDTAAALRAKGEDLIRVGGWHRKIDEASGIGEVER
jgi:hypothetical protein